MMADSVKTTFKGPLFDGTVERVMKQYAEEVELDAAQRVENEVLAILRRDLRNPTGFYQRHITTERQANDRVVTDGDVVYGPWLEGVSSRNSQTRFKGYAAFRRATRAVQAHVLREAEQLLAQRYERRLNG